jgi:hypothetical protein
LALLLKHLAQIPVAVLILGGFMSAGAQACSGRIMSSPKPSADYNPFDPVANVRSYTVNIENRASETCFFWLRFDPPAGSAGWQGSYDFEIRSETGTLLAARGQMPGSSQRLASPALAPDDAYDFHYTVKMPAGQMLASGNYDQQIEINLTGTTGAEPPPNAPPSDTASISLATAVQDYFGLNIAGAGTMKTIDFGELTQGESQRVVVEARSNTNFTLKAYSANRGVLAMAPPYETWQIPYSLSIDGSTVALPSEVGPFSVTSIAGHSFNLDFTVGDVSQKRAGLYSDEITIEILPGM